MGWGPIPLRNMSFAHILHRTILYPIEIRIRARHGGAIRSSSRHNGHVFVLWRKKERDREKLSDEPTWDVWFFIFFLVFNAYNWRCWFMQRLWKQCRQGVRDIDALLLTLADDAMHLVCSLIELGKAASIFVFLWIEVNACNTQFAKRMNTSTTHKGKVYKLSKDLHTHTFKVKLSSSSSIRIQYWLAHTHALRTAQLNRQLSWIVDCSL